MSNEPKETLQRVVARTVGSVGAHGWLAQFASSWTLGSTCWRPQRRTRKCFQILTYHRVNDDGDPIFPGVPVEVFSRQVEFLRRNYQIIDLHEALESAVLPDRAICLTFDDGYLDSYTQAFPVLKAYGAPATIFLATGFIGNNRRIWHDKVFDAFRRTQLQALDWPATPFDQLPLEPISSRCRTMELFLEHIRRLHPRERDAAIRELLLRLEVRSEDFEKRLMLNWDEIRQMAQAGITFGGHTEDHTLLSTVTGEELQREIEDCYRRLKHELGGAPKLFAYPNGRVLDFNEESVRALQQVGFTAAVTTCPGVNTQVSDRFRLRRMGVADSDRDVFGCRVSWYRLQFG